MPAHKLINKTSEVFETSEVFSFTKQTESTDT
jgi:hypothetical protein